MTTVLYFAWMRERVGLSEERLDLPGGLATVADVLDYIGGLSAKHAHALERRDLVRVALDQVHVTHESPLGTPQEIALFPPVTGG